MRLTFNIDYRTSFGEELVVNILPQEDGQGVKKHRMGTQDQEHWSASVVAQYKPGTYIDYYYSVEKNGQEWRTEWLTEPHRLEFAAKRGVSYTIYDHWLDIPEDSYAYSSAFTDCVFARKRELSPSTESYKTVRLKVRAPQLRLGERLALLGATMPLGEWTALKALPMKEHEPNEWVISLDADKLVSRHLEFKFVILDSENDVTPVWETGYNRILDLPELSRNEVVVFELSQPRFDIHPWRAAGTVIPVFSLRSEGSFGVGDFGDLKLMVDWCKSVGQHVLQVLPINDTGITHTWQDSYPYNSISIYALHPQYIDLRQMPELKDKERAAYYEELRKELNSLPQIDYERVNEEKISYLRDLYKQSGSNTMRSKAFKEFFEKNAEWLVPYAAFCHYRDLYGTATFSQWPHHRTLSEGEIIDMQDTRTRIYKEVAFWYYVQFNLDQQMRAAHEHARSQRVILKGDIPIGISRDGVEAWVEPHYFNMNGQAGAPPDFFSKDGQLWGFPTYNWDEMLKDDCRWWVRRFSKMAEYFDAYRIDHVLGFLRIWEIPITETSGLKGQFAPGLPMTVEEIESYGMQFHEELFLKDHKRPELYHPQISGHETEFYAGLPNHEKEAFWRLRCDFFYRRHNQFWYTEAMKKLPRLTQATRMLVCAEDLGMVPECVPHILNDLKILSLEIQTMPKDEHERFSHLSRNPYRSVDTISTHDMPTLRMWWDENHETTQDYYQSRLHRGGDAPHPLPGWLAKEQLSRHLSSPSMLSLHSLQDWLAMDEELRLPDAQQERINEPQHSRHYWRYRMHLTIEQLQKADKFNNAVREIIRNNNR